MLFNDPITLNMYNKKTHGFDIVIIFLRFANSILTLVNYKRKRTLNINF